MSTDPFAHLPHLRDRLTPPEHSALRPTAGVLAEWDERARKLGRPGDWRLPDHVREQSRKAVLANRDPSHDLWVYGYGSLMWDPGIHFSEVRIADLAGYQRRFTFKSPVGRGTTEFPALMLALESRPGICRGLAFRIAAEAAEVESEILWRREMLRGGYSPTLVPLVTPQGRIEALVFTANHAHADYAGERSLTETAAIIATASGPVGTNREYLEQVAAQLAALEIEDEYIVRLLEHVQRTRSA